MSVYTYLIVCLCLRYKLITAQKMLVIPDIECPFAYFVWHISCVAHILCGHISCIINVDVFGLCWQGSVLLPRGHFVQSETGAVQSPLLHVEHAPGCPGHCKSNWFIY